MLPNGQPDRLPDGLYRGFGWLVRLAPEAAVCTSQLENLLADPDMMAMLAALPPMARLLRPLCRMLAVAPGVLSPRRRPRRGPDPAAGSAPRDPPYTAPPEAPAPVPKRRRMRLARPAWRPPW